MRNWIDLLVESTGSECDFFEVEGEWWYLLEQGEPDYDDQGGRVERGDWRDDAVAEGPFPDYDTAREHLRDHHPNPGGSNNYGSDYDLEPVVLDAMKEARARKAREAEAEQRFYSRFDRRF